MTNDRQVLSIYEGAAGFGAINLSAPEVRALNARLGLYAMQPPRLGADGASMSTGLTTTEMVGIGVGVVALAAIAYYATR